jgi:hypothetical protein
MSPATLAVIIQSLPILLQLAEQAVSGIRDISDTIQQAQAEGRDLTQAELDRFAALSNAALAAWDNRGQPTP